MTESEYSTFIQLHLALNDPHNARYTFQRAVQHFQPSQELEGLVVVSNLLLQFEFEQALRGV